ncbi:DNA cytosine methyltransferase [Geothrix campi]|uniref:DNA cytosine methyltransferase n=1 Tax=Geothrix campi TaxID=2966450 RepID=UPI003CC590E3
MRELHLFAGAGGGILGGLLLGHVPVCAVELEAYPRSVLIQRQRDGLLPWFPVWDDVCTFDGNPWRGRVDIIAGGFPCQDISSAGKGAGIDGARSGLWGEFARIVDEVRPSFVLVENSPMLTSRGLGRVLGDLATLGFDAEWGVLGADDAGAPHIRKRIWILAHAERPERRPQGARECNRQGWGGADRLPAQREEVPSGPGAGREVVAHAGSGWGQDHELRTGRDLAGVRCEELADAHSRDEHRRRSPLQMGRQRSAGEVADDGHTPGTQWSVEPALGRVAHGVAHRVDRLRAIGNGQVPAVAALAWETLRGRTQQRREAVA